MPRKSSSNERVRKARAKHRAADTTGSAFAEQVRRQCRGIVAAENTPEGQEEIEFWERIADEDRRDAWR
jgi:hypothetical protein